MKKTSALLLATLSLALLAASCGKQKTCRCSVVGMSTVRIVEIDGGECSQLTKYSYHNEHDQNIQESLVCTDYEFAIDTIYGED